MLIHAALTSACYLWSETNLDAMDHLQTTDATTTRIYLVRHGESAFNIPGADGVKLTSGKSHSIPLTDKGREQATSLGHKLCEKLPKEDRYLIVSSTALRASETADRIFETLHSNFSIEHGGCFENFIELGQGKWEGKPKNNEYEAELKKWEYLTPKEKWTEPKIVTGESYQQVAERALGSLQKIVDEHPDKTLLIATHYQAMNALAVQWSGCVDHFESPEPSFPSIAPGNCDLVLIELEKGKKVQDAKISLHIKSRIE